MSCYDTSIIRNHNAKLKLESTGHVFSSNPLECSICNHICNTYIGLKNHLNTHDENYGPRIRRLNSKVRCWGVIISTMN